MIHKYFDSFMFIHACSSSAAGIYMKRYAVVKCGNLLSLNRQFNVLGQSNRHSCAAIPMELLNDINGIVQQNQ